MKVVIFFISLLILGGSFTAVYALSKLRVNLENKKQENNNYYLSFAISLVIPLFNIIIQRTFVLMLRSAQKTVLPGKRLHNNKSTSEHCSKRCDRISDQLNSGPNHCELLLQRIKFIRCKWVVWRCFLAGSNKRFLSSLNPFVWSLLLADAIVKLVR